MIWIADAFLIMLAMFMLLIVYALMGWEREAERANAAELAAAAATLDHAIDGLSASGIGRDLEYASARWIMQNAREELGAAPGGRA